MKLLKLDYYANKMTVVTEKVADMNKRDIVVPGKVFIQENTQALGVVQEREDTYNLVCLYYPEDPSREARYNKLADMGQVVFCEGIKAEELVELLAQEGFYATNINFLNAIEDRLVVGKQKVDLGHTV